MPEPPIESGNMRIFVTDSNEIHAFVAGTNFNILRFVCKSETAVATGFVQRSSTFAAGTAFREAERTDREMADDIAVAMMLN